jgi:hypothetical protein
MQQTATGTAPTALLFVTFNHSEVDRGYGLTIKQPNIDLHLASLI